MQNDNTQTKITLCIAILNISSIIARSPLATTSGGLATMADITGRSISMRSFSSEGAEAAQEAAQEEEEQEGEAEEHVEINPSPEG